MEVQQFKVFMAPSAGVEVTDTLYSGFIGEGPKVKEFEASLKGYLGAPNVLAVNSGTSALHLALRLAQYRTGCKKVITTPLTCFATTAAILQAGLEPVWCDVDPKTCNIDLDCLKNILNSPYRPYVAAVVIVHYGGYPVDVDALHNILETYKNGRGTDFRPLVVEDCAHSIGAKTQGGMVGAGRHGNYCCYSFQAIKTLTTGDGGAIVVPDRDYDLCKKLRWFGMDRDQDRMTQDIPVSGFKYHMNDLSATIGLSNIQFTESLVAKQLENVRWYAQAMPEFAPAYRYDFQSSGWMYPVRVGNAADFDRAMKERGVGTGLTHKRNDQYTCVSKADRHVRLDGVAEAERSVSCIPSGWWVDEEKRQYVVDCMKKGW